MEEHVLSENDYAEACRRYKEKRTKFQEPQRYHALILVTQGYSYHEVSRILLVTEEAIRQWVARYETKGLAGLENHPRWGGEHGQRGISTEQLTALEQFLYGRHTKNWDENWSNLRARRSSEYGGARVERERLRRSL